MSILIKNTTIISEGCRILRGDILISDSGVVEELGKDIVSRGAEVIDGRKYIAMPGLINTHTHVAMALFRGYGDGLPLKEWLETRIWPAEAKLTDEVVKAGTTIGIIEMLKSGTTAFNEMYLKGMDSIMKAADALNIRLIIAQGMLDVNSSIDEEIRKCNEVIGLTERYSNLIRPAVSCHAPYTASDELIVKAKELANKNNLLFHIHVSETRKEVYDIVNSKGKRPIEYLDSIGVLDNKTVLAHASWVSKREINIAGDRKVVISHNPVSNLKLATGGIAPIIEYDKAGAIVTLGTDGAASNNTLNMFETMKFAALMQIHKYWDALAITPNRVFEYATSNGGISLNVPGAIEKGKEADIILVRKTPNLLPLHNLISNLVYAASPVLVDYVFVAGKPSLLNGKVPNEDEIIDNAVQVIQEFFG